MKRTRTGAFVLACQLNEAALRVRRRQLRRQFPMDAKEQIQQRFREWMLARQDEHWPEGFKVVRFIDGRTEDGFTFEEHRDRVRQERLAHT